MSPVFALWLASASLLVACLAATAGRSLAEFSPHELTEICRRRKSSDRLVPILKQRDEAILAADALQVLAAAAYVGLGLYGIWSKWTAAEPFEPLLLGSGLFGGILALVLALVWIPRAVAGLWANPFLYFTWPVWRVVAAILFPLVLGGRFVDAVLHRLAGRPAETTDEDSFEDDIRTIVTEGHREGLLEEDAREMIEGIIELGDADVSEIMTPRTDMVSMPTSMSWQELTEFVVRVGHTRIPVHNKNRDDIVGVLYTKDLLPVLTKGAAEPAQPWTTLLREPYFVPETKPIDVLLQEFQRTGNHMALVLDEYGGVSGLVTIEDVLEEIVGEIADEYDEGQVEEIRELGDGVSEVLGRVHVDELNERLGLDLPEEGDFDTIAGYVFHELGHVPVVGEELVRGNVRFTVIEATPRRIERVRIEILEGPQRQTA